MIIRQNSISTSLSNSVGLDLQKTQANRTAELVQALDDLLADNPPERYKACGDFEPDFLEACQEFRMARKEWDARVFLVVACGPVKAGKSTLVNLLAGRYVSPVAREECTRRPSLILQAREDEAEVIEVFYSAQTGADDQRRHPQMKNFDGIMAYLKGSITADELRAHYPVEYRHEHLDPANIQHYLAEPLPNEPLLVVLKVRPQETAAAGSIINEHLGLVDMPGLDGSQAGTEAASFHQWIFAHADFLLFVQSSIAALTGQVSSFIETHWSHRHRNLPVWMIHNQIDAKYWHDETKRREEDAKAAKLAVRELEQHIGITNIRVFQCNLAMAWDAFIQAPKVYYDKYHQKSRYGEFRDLFREHIARNHKAIHAKNWIRDKIPNHLMAIRDTLQKIKERLRKENREFRDDQDKVRKAREILNDCWDSSHVAYELEAILQQELESVKRPGINAPETPEAAWMAEAEAVFEKRMPEAMISGEDLENLITDILKEIGRKGDRILMGKSRLLRIRERCEKFLDSVEEPLRKQLQEIWGDQIDLPDANNMYTTQFGSFDRLHAPFRIPEHVTIKKEWDWYSPVWIWKGWTVRYDEDEVETKFALIKDPIKNEISARVQEWKKQIMDAVGAYQQSRFELYRRILDSLEQQMNARQEEFETLRRQVESEVERLELNLKEIQRIQAVAAGFFRSMP